MSISIYIIYNIYINIYINIKYSFVVNQGDSNEVFLVFGNKMNFSEIK